MKCRALTLCAGLLLLLGLMPGSALAAVPSNLDQSNETHTVSVTATGILAQTVTAGRSGLFTGVDVYLGGVDGTVTLALFGTTGGLPDETKQLALSAGTSVTTTAGWVHFSFPDRPSVTSGTVYAILSLSGPFETVYGSGNVYTRGKALAYDAGLDSWSDVANPADFAFRTYVDSTTADLHWSKTQIKGGVSTPLTLTFTMTYRNGSEAWRYDAAEVGLPSWFLVNSITCSAQIAPGDCSAVGFASGISVPAVDGGETLTITLVGTASPVLADIGSTGTASGEACLSYRADEVIRPSQPGPGCAIGNAGVQVVAVLATPPPSNTDVGSASDQPAGTIWLLPVALVALFGCLLFLVARQRRWIQ